MSAAATPLPSRAPSVEDAVADLLDALGVDRAAAGVRDTPRRVAGMYRELLTPEPFTPTTFPNDAGYDGLVVVRDVAFSSLCEHHLLPFFGTAHLAYLPGERIIGLSKLPRIVDALTRRLQVQERLTVEIADEIERVLAPRGVGVVLEATHMCMSLRGVRQPGAVTTTSALRGLLRTDPVVRDEFLTAGDGRTARRRP